MHRVAARIAIITALVGALLVPSLAAPARTISLPTTLARSLSFASTAAGLKPAFPPTHIAFSWTGEEGTGIRFRTLSADGTLSRWARAPETHDLEHGDRHYSAIIAVDRPTYVAWRAVRPRGASITNITVDYLNTVDGPRETVRIPAIAEAAASTPSIVTRARWGADESLKRTSGGCKRSFFRVQQLFVHHTAGRNFDPKPAATMRAIYWYHTVRRGWCDLGYNFVIAPDGRIFEGRWARRYAPWEVHSSEDRSGRAVSGAHVSGFNSGSVGVSLMGNFSTASPSPAMRRSLAEVLAWEADRHNLKPMSTHIYRNPETGRRKSLYFIAGHRDAGQTACPGSIAYRHLDAIRRDTKAVMGAGKESTGISLAASATRVDYGETVQVDGRLVDSNGTGMVGAAVKLYRKNAGADWRVDQVLTTGADGSFGFSLAPKRKVVFAAVYEGDAQRWGAQTRNLAIKVRPRVTLSPEGGVADPLGNYHFPSSTETVTLSGNVMPAHPGGRVKMKIFERHSDGSETLVVDQPLSLDDQSRYSYVFEVPRPGTYVALVWFRNDGDHLTAHSPPVTLVFDL